MFTQTLMGLESLESAIKYESAVAKHGRAIVDQAAQLQRTSMLSFDQALDHVLSGNYEKELPRSARDRAIDLGAVGNRHERRKAAKLARSKR